MSPKLKVLDHPVANHKLTQLRADATNSDDFRRLVRDVAMILAIEASKDVPTQPSTITTPVGPMVGAIIPLASLTLISILRAGNGLLDGMMAFLPGIRAGFIGMARDEKTLQPVCDYKKLPAKLGSTPVWVLDPMLATAGSAIASIDILKQSGAVELKLINLVAAPEGVERFHQSHPDVPILTAALDQRLNEKGYIVPGLGDAGDRIFGTAPTS